MAFVDQEKTVSAEIRQFTGNLADREDLRTQTVLVSIIFPHGNQVLWTDDECFQAIVVLKDTSERCSHKRFAEPDHIADQDASTFIQMSGGNLDGSFLKLEQLVAELFRDAKLRNPRPRLLGQVIGHLDVNVVRRNRLFSGPALLDNGDQLF